MKRLLPILLCLPLTAGGIQRDKQLHAGAGAVAYVTGYEIAKSLDAKHPKWWGLGSALALGVVKEAMISSTPRRTPATPRTHWRLSPGAWW